MGNIARGEECLLEMPRGLFIKVIKLCTQSYDHWTYFTLTRWTTEKAKIFELLYWDINLGIKYASVNVIA
jgi:hypothetical protein